MMLGIASGKTQKLIKMQESMDIDYYFDFDDIVHTKEIREQILATTGKKNCKIIWCVSLNLFLQHKKLIKENK